VHKGDASADADVHGASNAIYFLKQSPSYQNRQFDGTGKNILSAFSLKNRILCVFAKLLYVRLRLICFLLLCSSPALLAQVVINEVCPANADLLYDPDFFNFSGWVELYNKGNAAVSVGRFALSDNAAEKNKWQIPSGVSIPAKGYLLIWCDGAGERLHTNFSLDSDGEELILSNIDLNQIDRIDFPKQYTNISYGRTSDGGTVWGHLINPTPGANNIGTTASVRLEKPQSSLPSGRYSGAQTLTILHSDPEAQIRYTLDGSEPTGGSLLYNGPITVTKTSTIKAKAFRSGFLPGKTEVATYFISEHAFSLPVVSITTKPDYLWDNRIGIYADGTNGIPGNCQSDPFNWNQEWHRHAVVEFFDSNGERQFDQDVDIRIGGACSRGFPQKSIVVKARDKYGKNTIDEKLFRTKAGSSYGSFILRNSGNDFWNTMFRDGLMQSLVVGQMDLDYLAYEPKIFYLNGSYWGIQNLREKIDADYFEANYGVDKDDLDLGEFQSPLEGSIDGYLSYVTTMQGMDVTSAEAFDYIDNTIDVQEFINYLTAEIYYCNTDWPGNNVKYWRQRSINGKWRWVLWDLDFGFALYTNMSYAAHPTLSFATEENGPGWPNPPWSTLHIRLLMQNPEFRTRFIQTLTTSLSTTFQPARVTGFIDSFKAALEQEMPFHLQRWNRSLDSWNSEVQRLRDFAFQRNDFMYGHIASFFGLGDRVSISLSANPVNQGGFTLNGITTRENLTNAPYFKGLPYTVQAVPETGYAFSHWNIQKRQSSQVSLVDRAGAWKYFDQGSEPAPDWATSTYNDSTWPEGPAELGYGEGDEQTVVSYGGDGVNKYITTYFRKTIEVADTTDFTSLTGKILFDDGAVVYLNGAEIFRANMPQGAVAYNTLANVNAAEQVYTPFTVPKGLIRPGANLLAVELHQNSVVSSDISFDLELQTVKLGDAITYMSSDLIVTDTANSDVTMEAVFVPAQPIQGLVINEFSALPTEWLDEKSEAEDWIEILNTGSGPIDLAGLYITDNLANKMKYQIRAAIDNGTVIGPGEFKVLWADEELNDGPLHVNIKLSGEGESIGIYQMVGSELRTIDEITYAAYLSRSSYSRIPDATGPFVLTGKTTPFAQNEFEMPVGIEESPAEGIAVYPNPVSGSLTIRSAGTIETVRICNTTGTVVKTFTGIAPDQAIALHDLSPGLYVLMIRSAGRWTTARIVKSH
jgi:hypothetical protein